MKKSLTLLLLGVLATLDLASSCFIRTCPYYSKREKRPLHYCQTCVGGLGQCVGPHTCCGPSIGCLWTSALFDIASDCSQESNNREPCKVKGNACTVHRSSSKHGVCVAPGICCEEDTCMPSDECPPGSHALAPISQTSAASNNEVEEELEEEPGLVVKVVRPKSANAGQQRIGIDVDETENDEEEISNKQVVNLLKKLLKSHHKTASASAHASLSSSGAAQSAPNLPVDAGAPPQAGKAKTPEARVPKAPAAPSGRP